MGIPIFAVEIRRGDDFIYIFCHSVHMLLVMENTENNSLDMLEISNNLVNM